MSKLKGKKALVVEDEEALREILVVQLTEEEVEAIEASCTAEALEMMQNQVVDFIISDVRMPGASGVELLKAVGQMDEEAKPEVLMMSGFSDITEKEAIELGALGLLPKPFRAEDLMDFLNENVGKNKKSEGPEED
jgi:two-component system phosphate regulon response regulator PhoB